MNSLTGGRTRNPVKRWSERLSCIDQATSTNDVIRRWAREGRPEGEAVLARIQTRGRGRAGRTWFSTPGSGMFLSVLLRPALEARRAARLTILVGLALAEVLRSDYGVEAGLKWPNDVRVGGRKLAGILCEASLCGTAVEYVVVGMGVNLNLGEHEFPEELRGSVTSLAMLRGGERFRPEALAGVFLDRLQNEYGLHLRGGWEEQRRRWEGLCDHLDEQGEWPGPAGEETLAGEAVGLSPDGGLLVKDERGVVREVICAP